MKYKTAFRLALKLLGLFYLIEGFYSLIIQLTLSLSSARWNNYGMYIVLVFKLLVGGYLFFGGKWLVDKVIPGNHPYCPECAYDLTGAVSERCPECGTPFSWDAVRPGKP